jgi:hypothetical protein
VATNAWKDQVRGFRGMEREEVMAFMESVIEDANWKCPRCSALERE